MSEFIVAIDDNGNEVIFNTDNIRAIEFRDGVAVMHTDIGKYEVYSFRKLIASQRTKDGQEQTGTVLEWERMNHCSK